MVGQLSWLYHQQRVARVCLLIFDVHIFFVFVIRQILGHCLRILSIWCILIYFYILVFAFRGRIFVFLQLFGESSLLQDFYPNYLIFLLFWRTRIRHWSLISFWILSVPVLSHSTFFLSLIIAGLFITRIQVFNPWLLKTGLHSPWHDHVLFVCEFQGWYKVLNDLSRSIVFECWELLWLLFLLGVGPREENMFHLMALMPRTWLASPQKFLPCVSIRFTVSKYVFLEFNCLVTNSFRHLFSFLIYRIAYLQQG